MTSGIYALYWWDQDLVYIGLSQKIYNRHKEHLRLLKKGVHTNQKVQTAYDKYGEPELIVLELADLDCLPAAEIYWCMEFDALGVNGLCIVAPGIVGFGADSNSSKYSKRIILKTFSLLYKGTLSLVAIAAKLKIPRHVPFDIQRGCTHLWLREVYPIQYVSMLAVDRQHIRNNRLDVVPRLLLSPRGDVVEVFNVSQFCLETFGNASDKKHLSSVLTGTRKSHKGYTKYIGK
jgi:hypothetical protein